MGEDRLDTSASAIEGPHFIVGAPRSGTTLLATLMARHSEIAVPPETQFAAFLGPNHSSRSTWVNHQSVVSALQTFIQFRELSLPLNRFRYRFEHYPPIPKYCFQAMLEEYASQHGKRICIEKSPNHLFFAEVLASWFPQARFICLVRDGRDVAVSLKRAEIFRFELRHGCLNWLRYVRLGRRLKHRFGRRWLEVRMEDLVKSPKTQLERIDEFIGVKYEDRQLDTSVETKLFVERELGWKQQSKEKIDPSKIGNYRKLATPEEIWLMNAIMAGELRRYGYGDTHLTNCPFLKRVSLTCYAQSLLIANTSLALRFRGWLHWKATQLHSKYERRHDDHTAEC